MKIKTLIQILILSLIIFIIGGVYYNYFNKRNIVEEIDISKSNINQIEQLEEKISSLELKNKELIEKVENSTNKSNKTLLENIDVEISEKNIKSKKIKNEDIDINETNKISEVEKKNIIKKQIINNLVKDVEYTSVDEKGNKFNLLATSGKSNIYNNDILDLKNVRGTITSDTRDTIYIVSDYAEYHSVNLNSNFYKNVVINYQDKEITCVNFDINMETNKAIAYNDVIITDPKSIMKAGIVEFDLKTKNININPVSSDKEVSVISN